MALEAVVFQQEFLGHNSVLGGGGFGVEKVEDRSCESFDFLENQTKGFLHGDWSSSSPQPPPPSMVAHQFSMSELPHLHKQNSSLDATNCAGSQQGTSTTMTVAADRPRRRRSKSRKNKEEIENQRMTHIAVERNRRKQMNEYLSVLRSLMPESYAQRGDQASIVGGAINFVKELEQQLQLLSAQKEMEDKSSSDVDGISSLFAEFFTFPVQYSTSSPLVESPTKVDETMSETQSAIADIKVTMVESHANLKIRSKTQNPGQLLKVIFGLSSMRLTILHLYVTTVEQTVLYSLNVKVEDDCILTSVDDIATAVYQLLGRIQEDKLS
ncbi:hypothetical protein SLE2022_082710 [Rubroshorea leprosula]